MVKAEYVDHMGSDLSVVNAARVSFDKVSEWVPSGSRNDYEGVIYQTAQGRSVNLKQADAKLIRYLAKHDHWTPFAHTTITLRMGAPVPIRTQCFKHKQGLVENEESRRYINSTPEVYVPEFLRVKADNAKQGSGGKHPYSQFWLEGYRIHVDEGLRLYEDMIDAGICPEQARFVLPQAAEVNWIWTGNLYAFANFFNKRTDSHAQKEVQELAHQVGRIIEPLFPVSWAALTR